MSAEISAKIICRVECMGFKFNGIDWNSQSFKIILIAALCQFSISMILNCMHVMLPQISSELNIPISSLNWITLIFLMTLLACSVPFSQNIGQRGIKFYIKIASYGLIIGLILNAISFNLELFFISRIIQGITMSVLNVCVSMIVILGMPDNKVGYALGFVSSAGYLGNLIAPTLSGTITSFLSWRFVFIFMIILFAFQLILLHLVEDEWKTNKKHSDKIGSVIFILMVCLMVYGFSSIIEDGLIPLIISFILLIVFVRTEKNKEYPVLNLDLLRNVPYLIGNYAAMVCHLLSFTVNYVLSIYLVAVMNLDAHVAGLMMMITPILMVLVSPYAGRLADYKDPRTLSIYGMAFMGLCMLLLGVLEFYPFVLIFVALTVRGIGHGIFSAPNSKFVLSSIPKDDLGNASALLSTSKEFGRIISLSMFNIICLIVMNNVPLETNIDGFAQSMNVMMFVTVIFAISSIVLLFLSKYYFDEESKPCCDSTDE